MAEHNDVGKAGEDLALQYLREKGMTVLETNWRFGKDEIDIIAKDKDMLVIVEVKTRRTNIFGEPEEAVNRIKQKFMVRAADAYVNRFNLDIETRFDIISVLLNGNKHQINHIPDAFYPTL